VLLTLCSSRWREPMNHRTRFSGPILLILTQTVAACSSAPPPRRSAIVSPTNVVTRSQAHTEPPVTPPDIARTLEELYVKPQQ
jgi:hypothetical protein